MFRSCVDTFCVGTFCVGTFCIGTFCIGTFCIGTFCIGTGGVVMEFRVLGPVEVHAKGRPLDLGPPQRRSLLAALLVDAGQWVSVETLITRVWDEDPPDAARTAVYTHIHRIRRLLADAMGVGGQAPVERRAGGYLLNVDRDRVDLHRVRRLVGRAREPGPDSQQRVGALREVLVCWRRGEPLANVAGGWAARTRQRIEQELVGAAVAWAEDALKRGRAATVITELSDVAGRYPLAEPLTAALIRALGTAGRSGEALTFYAVTRAHLLEHLGAEPGPQLRAVHDGLLRGQFDQSSTTTRPEPGTRPRAGTLSRPEREEREAGAGREPVPAQLPMDVAGFSGRAAELDRLDALLESAGSNGTAMVISAIAGTAGVGKTALAVHWAHRVAGRFPDGQLYVDLRGYDPNAPVEPTDALAAFLRTLSVSGGELPTELDERAARYRTLVSRRRMLILLDNASSVEQVRPLLPGSGSCLVVLTSRDALAGLVVREGAHRLVLDLLSAAEAVALLEGLIGDRVAADPAAAHALAEACSRLPLALRIAAELAAARPDATLADLTAELTAELSGGLTAGQTASLAGEQDRLARLDVNGDPRSGVAAVFSWSYRHLPAPVAGAFRLLGLHVGADFTGYGLAALGDTDLAGAERTLDILLRAHLITRTGPDRYVMHDLLRAYASRLSREHDPPAARTASITRLLDNLLFTAAVAMDLVYAPERHRRPPVAPPGTPVPRLSDPAAAAAWLDDERPNLLAAVAHAATHGWPEHATKLATILFRYLNLGGYRPEALAAHTHGLHGARQTGDRDGEANTLINMAIVQAGQGRLDRAAELYQSALTVFEELGTPLGQARALHNLGVVCLRQSRDDEAAGYFERAVGLFQTAQDASGEAAGLGSLGMLLLRQGRAAESAEHHRRALALVRAVGDRFGEARQLTYLGMVHAGERRFGRATAHYRRAAAVAEDTGDLGRRAEALYHLGLVFAEQGRYEMAAEHHERALAIAEQTCEAYGRTLALNGLGEVFVATDRMADAEAAHEAALATATGLGNRHEQARAHEGLARVYEAGRDGSRANRHRQAALRLRPPHDLVDVYRGAPVKVHQIMLRANPPVSHRRRQP